MSRIIARHIGNTTYHCGDFLLSARLPRSLFLQEKLKAFKTSPRLLITVRIIYVAGGTYARADIYLALSHANVHTSDNRKRAHAFYFSLFRSPDFRRVAAAAAVAQSTRLERIARVVQCTEVRTAILVCYMCNELVNFVRSMVIM